MLVPGSLLAQVDEAKAAIERGENVRAVNLLSPALAGNPSADVYLYLGIAYRNMREWERAENVFKEGGRRFERDPRFPNELADLYLTNNESDRAREALRDALHADPDNVHAADLLATIEMSEGNVRSALHAWNRLGRPIVDDIRLNSYVTIRQWTFRESLAFHPEGVLRYEDWRTTRLRLLETQLYSNASLNVEPTPAPNRYSVDVLAPQRGNSLTGIGANLAKGLPVLTSFLDVWNIGNSGVSIRSKYRWDANRRRGEVLLLAPLPLPGILFLEATGVWRSEQWDISTIVKDPGPLDRFRYKSTGARIELKQIPTHWLEYGAGYEYQNRAASGGPPELLTNSSNAGKLLFHTTLRLADARYQNRLRAETEVARKGFFGDSNYTKGTIELNNRLPLSTKNKLNAFNWTIKGGASRGQLPVEEYFMLGVDSDLTNVLRGHKTVHNGRYGRSPLATSFVIANTEFERRLGVLPTFNALNLPYIEVKGEVFLDVARTWDRAQIFKDDKTLIDVGVGLKLVTPTRSFNLTYGHSLRENDNIFTATVEKLW